MAKRYKANAHMHLTPTQQKALLILSTVIYFFVVCLISPSTVKGATVGLIAVAIALGCVCFSRLRERITIPLLLLAAFVAVDGFSTLYAVSGKFALYEFSKVLAAFCLALVLLALAPGEGTSPARWIAKVLSGFSAIAGLVSIDILSTRAFSGAVLGLLGIVTTDYSTLAGVEPGVRMTSIFDNPNIFAGVVGIGVLLSLGLVCTAEDKKERTIQTVILYINALSFLLAFSMGAIVAIAAGFLVYLILERKERRTGLLILMVETLIFTVAAAAVISMTSFQAWSGFQPVPALCIILGAAVLCLADRFAGQKMAGKLEGHGKLATIAAVAVVAVMAAFVLAAYNLTGDITLDAKGTLRRAAYPDPGTYSLSVETNRALTVTIESQNQQETMMHTGTILYRGDASTASFTVPEESLVVYFNFTAPEGAHIQSVSYAGDGGSGSIPLDYKLLPSFIANRLQGLWANENAIQRFVFFTDGLKLFGKSPLIGFGMGGFESRVRSVQSFYYETKYVHNHYIQTLTDTGIVGFVLFVLLMVGSAAAVLSAWRKKENVHPLVPALGAGLAFMAGHGLVEVVFSSYPYLPIAFGVFGLISLCCGEALPKPQLNQKVKTVSMAVFSVLMAVFGVLLGCNMYARHVATAKPTLASLNLGVNLDIFEWTDYAMSYVAGTAYLEMDSQGLALADSYAERLEKVDSNSIPRHLADYYFRTGQTEKAFAMLEKFVNYVASDAGSWQAAFDLAIQYVEYTDVYRAGVLRLAQMLDNWNEANMGEIALSGASQALIVEMRAAEP